MATIGVEVREGRADVSLDLDSIEACDLWIKDGAKEECQDKKVSFCNVVRFREIVAEGKQLPARNHRRTSRAMKSGSVFARYIDFVGKWADLDDYEDDNEVSGRRIHCNIGS